MKNLISINRGSSHVLKTRYELEVEVLDLLYKQFNYRMQSKVGQFKQMHVLRNMRKDVARIKVHLSTCN